MSPRRPNPKPAPYIAKDGTKTWRVRYRLGTTATSETFTARADALDFAADIRDFGAPAAVRRLEQRLAGTRHGPTLGDVFDEFIAWKTPRVKSTRTIEDYRRAWETTMRSTFGNRAASTITDADVQRWVDALVAGQLAPRNKGGALVPLAAKTIVDRHGLLHSIFGFAAMPSRAYVPSNPCASTDLPERRKGPPKGLCGGEWAALYPALRQINQDAADLALALYGTGARLGEITALSVVDVEEGDRGRLVLTIGHVLRREAGGQFVRVEDTKSEAGFRRVGVDAELGAMIRRRVDVARSRMSTARPQDRGLIFTNAQGRYWLPSTFYTAWYAAVDVANLSRRPTPHWLRHTHVAELIRAGAPMPEIQARIGHEHFATTVGVYGRTIDGVTGDVLERLAARRGDGVGLRELASGVVVEGEIVADP